ncbi:MAG TPA: Gmad2 immunoglobulin-like domain-containing protein [Mycobacteriales bacterium]|nr:Gmad2 immunoglobulin-like domain-containing protein [Mycobacteriales bacterium]
MSDDRTEDVLRRALSLEAQQVQPTGDGLSRIQQRVAARQSRYRWLRPALAGAAAVIVVGGAVGGYAVANHGKGDATVTPENSGTPTPVVTASSFPTTAIFPFTKVADERAWEAEYAQGSMPFASDPTAVTESWIEHYLLEKGHFSFTAQTDGGQSDVTVSRTIGAAKQAVTVVHLVQYDHAWLVTGASDAGGALQFSAPLPGTAVSSPVTVTGPAYGVDEQATVEVRDGETPDLFGEAQTGPFGNGSAQWSATVPFTATSDSGVLVVTVASPADGKVGELAAEKVTFGATTGHTAAPETAYAVEGGSLVKLNPTTGASEGSVAAANAEGTVTEVHVQDGSLEFTAGPPGCAATLYAMPVAGGTPAVAARADSGDEITGFTVGVQGRVVYFERGCGPDAGQGKLVFPTFGHGPSGSEVSFPSLPPLVVGDPAVEPDNLHVDAFVRTGNEGYLARYDIGTTKSATPSTSACPGFDPAGGLAAAALTTDANGTLWFAWQTGTGIQVVQCADNRPAVAFTTTENDTPSSLSINPQGQALLATTTGKLWRWNGSGDPTELSDVAGATSIAWQ